MSQQNINIPSVKFSNGIDFPLVGLGTFRTDGDSDVLNKAIKYAVEIGYRHFDCAWLYNNEAVIGQAIKEAIMESNGALKRQDIFLTSKVWNTHHSRALVRENLDETLKNLDVDYIDLYLVHWPMGFKENAGLGAFPKDDQGNRLHSDVHYLETYKAMEELVKEGKIKSIGVSNFNLSQVQDVLNNCEIKPVNNQIELNPYLQQKKLVDFCQKNNIVVSAYGPIGAGQDSTNQPDLLPLLQNEVIAKLAAKYNKSPAQICLRWGVQSDVVVLPKSVKPERIRQNANIFDFSISDEDMKELEGLDRNYRNYGVEILKDHKFYPFNE